MVSGLVTSPHDHQLRRPAISSRSRSLGSLGPRISSGEAIRTWMLSNADALCSRVLRKSIIRLLLAPVSRRAVRRAETISVGAHADKDAQGLELLHEHVEGLRNAGLRQVLALDDRLVDAAA